MTAKPRTEAGRVVVMQLVADGVVTREAAETWVAAIEAEAALPVPALRNVTGRTDLCDACGHHLHRPQPCGWTIRVGGNKTPCPCPFDGPDYSVLGDNERRAALRRRDAAPAKPVPALDALVATLSRDAMKYTTERAGFEDGLRVLAAALRGETP